MSNVIGEFIDRHPKIGFAFAVVVCAAVALAMVYAIITPEEPSAMDRACMDEFGQEWENSGYLGGYPPSLQCTGPDGLTGIMEMPKEIRDKHGIVLDTDDEPENT